ncbi:ABC transporter substrate-binding protein [Pseudomonas sp. MM211]|uniref:heme/hemin ABC transporter substrate-binding protein n=1 Tax=Pseudomonas sp. MM211 TaxID=2866808 RepID=UPI001CED6604|nr:ABC transporter substrate-binding protein [Pseudomonas sp. MM211]UCJ16844.1 ABC transporter substrate-binding protein [Pseudomonas sp. MM211]
MTRPIAVFALFASLLSPLVASAENLPQRWVSAGGSLSEWVVELGGEGKLVGVDTTSLHPASLKKLPSVGYQRQLAAEGILALRPEVLLGTDEMGPPPVLAQLAAAGVKVETLSAEADLQALHGNLQRIGALLGDEAHAESVFSAYQARLNEQADWVAKAQADSQAPTVLLLLGHAGSSPMAGGQDTAAAWVIEHAGGKNLTTHNGYKALSTEALLALDPEVVIFADRRLSGDEAKQALLKQNPALASTKAGKEGRLVAIDPTLLVGGLGPRIPAGLAELSAAFYPGRTSLNSATP